LRVIALYNIKGGVGKTASAVNLAYLSAASGARTLVWDLDPQGAATFYFRIEPRVEGGARRLIEGRRPIDGFIRGTDYAGLDLLPADFSYRKLDLRLNDSPEPKRQLARLIEPLSRDYDHLYLDCAPGISLVSEAVFEAADVLLVPTLPTTLSQRTLEQLERHLERNGPRGLQVFPFFCMVDRRKALHREICEASRSGSFEFLHSRIPYSSVVEQMGLHRAPVAVHAPGSEAAQAYEALWQEVMTRSGSLLGWLGRFAERLSFF
jgi:cellulose biosynthesis protein BcsQ